MKNRLHMIHFYGKGKSNFGQLNAVISTATNRQFEVILNIAVLSGVKSFIVLPRDFDVRALFYGIKGRGYRFTMCPDQ